MDFTDCLSIIKQELDKLSLKDYAEIQEKVLSKALTNHLIELEKIIKNFSPELIEQLIKDSNAIFNGENVTYQGIILSENLVRICYSWLYWCQYVKELKKRVVIVQLKKYFGFKNCIGHDTILLPIILKEACPNCENMTEYSYTLKEVSLCCKFCEHKEYYPKQVGWLEFGGIVKCECKFCKTIKKEIHQNVQSKIQEMILILSKNVEEVSQKYCNDKSNFISLRKQEMDYKLHASSLTKDEREVFSYRPTTYEELISTLDILDEQKAYWKKNYKVKVLAKLKQHGVIYTVRECQDIESAKSIAILNLFGRTQELLANGYGGINHDPDVSRRNIKILLKTLTCGTYEEFYSRVSGNKNYFIGPEGTWEGRTTTVLYPHFFDAIYFSNLEMNIELPLTEKIIFNQYYFNAPPIEPIGINTKKIFNSDGEKSVFYVLRNQYPDTIIIPNKRLADVIDIYNIKASFTDQEFEYLRNCILDFCIYNFEGELLKIIELQKGEHHNSTEWIFKDNLKRNACKKCAIEIEEKF